MVECWQWLPEHSSKLFKQALITETSCWDEDENQAHDSLGPLWGGNAPTVISVSTSDIQSEVLTLFGLEFLYELHLLWSTMFLYELHNLEWIKMKKRKEGNYYTILYIIIRYIILYGVRRHRSQVTVYTVYTGHRPQATGQQVNIRTRTRHWLCTVRVPVALPYINIP